MFHSSPIRILYATVQHLDCTLFHNTFSDHLGSAFPNGYVFSLWVMCTVYETYKYFFSKNNFKTEFHDTDNIFKNYFVTIFSIFNNKRYPNRPLVSVKTLLEIISKSFVMLVVYPS